MVPEKRSLKPDEVERIVRESIEKAVSVVYVDGTTQELFVHTVDDEGFVCDLVSEMAEPPRCAYWVRFTDVREVRSSNVSRCNLQYKPEEQTD